MNPRRTLVEAAYQIALDEIAFATPNRDDSPEKYNHKEHTRSYVKAIGNLPNDDSDNTLRAKEAALSQHHPMQFHASEAAESIASAHDQGQKADLDDIINFHFTNGYIQSMKQHHSDKYPKLMNAHPPTIDKHAEAFQDHVGAFLETHHGIGIDEDGNTQDI